MIRLILTVEDETGRRYAFSAKESPVLIGGSVLADLRLVHPQIAPLHARVTFDEMNATLEDLDSKTGCTKNGRRIPSSKQEGILDDAPVVLGGVFRLASSWGEVDDGTPDGNPFTDTATRDREEDLATMSAAARAARAERLRAPIGGAAGLGRIAYGGGDLASSRLPASSKTLFRTGPTENEGGRTLLHMPASFPAGKGLPGASGQGQPSGSAGGADGTPGSGASSEQKPRAGARTLDSGGIQAHQLVAAAAAVSAPGLTPEVGSGTTPGHASTATAAMATAAMTTGTIAARETPSWSSPSLPPAQQRGMPSAQERGTPGPVAGGLEFPPIAAASAASSGGGTGALDPLVPRLPDTVLAMPSAADLAASLPPSPATSGEARTLLEVPSPFIVRTALAATMSAPPHSPSPSLPSFKEVAPRSDNPRATRVGRVAWATEGASSQAETPAVSKGPAPAAPKGGDGDGDRGWFSKPASPRSAAPGAGRGGDARGGEDARAGGGAPSPRQEPELRAAASRQAPAFAAAPAPAERCPADLSKLREKVQHLPRRQPQGRLRRGGNSRKQTLLLVAVFVATLASVLGVGAWVVLRSSEEPLPPEDTRTTPSTAPSTTAASTAAPSVPAPSAQTPGSTASSPEGPAPGAGSPPSSGAVAPTPPPPPP